MGDYMEKVLCRMNVTNCDLKTRLAWYISKAYYKQAVSLQNERKYKLAYPIIVKADQFLNVHIEVLTNNIKKYPFMSAFKSDVKRKDLRAKIDVTLVVLE